MQSEICYNAEMWQDISKTIQGIITNKDLLLSMRHQVKNKIEEETVFTPHLRQQGLHHCDCEGKTTFVLQSSSLL